MVKDVMPGVPARKRTVSPAGKFIERNGFSAHDFGYNPSDRFGIQPGNEIYKGPVWASHHNCRTLVKNQRQLTDSQIRILIERGR
jgi:hypothetical protein